MLHQAGATSRRMAIGKSPPKNRKAAARPQDLAPASPAASRSRAAPRLAAPKSKGRNSKSTSASPLTVDIPTTPCLASFLSPLDVAAIQQVSARFIRLDSSFEKLLFAAWLEASKTHLRGCCCMLRKDCKAVLKDFQGLQPPHQNGL